MVQRKKCPWSSCSKDWAFPFDQDQETINRRLDGKIINGQERKYCRILTEEEEQTTVSYVKNKNRCLQDLNQSELTECSAFV